MVSVTKSVRDAITAQAIQEIEFARTEKQQHYARWHKNEDLYYNKKIKLDSDRANVNLNEAQSFVQTFLSKTNTPYNFKYLKWEEADLQAAKVVNALKDKDSKLGDWNTKITDARTQMIIYGRYIMEYHADQQEGKYCSHLSNVDVYQFLIDPSCGGQDIERAYYMGRGNILKSKKQIKEGVKNGIYLRTEAEQLLSWSGNFAEQTEEDRESDNRYISVLTQARVRENPDVYKFWEWYTTYEGQRYYLLLCETGWKAIRVQPIEEVFASGKYPFFTVAAYPDLTEFWTPSPLDGVRDTIIAKNVTINQMLDNAEAINRPMRAFDVGAVENPLLLKFRKDWLIPVKSGFNVQQAIQSLPVIPLTTSLQVYDKLDIITSTQSGVTNGARGNANEDKVGIYEGNQANAADRFALIQDSEARWQKRFAELYLAGLDEHMTGKIAIEMIGLDWTEFTEVTRKDIKRGKSFDIVIQTAGSEETMQTTLKRNKLTFLQSNKQNPLLNQQVLVETEAQIVWFNPDEIKAMLSKDYGEAELYAECARDIQDIISGKKVKPNEIANTAYLQKLLDFMRDNEENLSAEKMGRLMIYFEELQPIVMRNMMTSINNTLAQEGLSSLQGQEMWMVGQAIPWQPVEWQPELTPQQAPVANPQEQVQY